jgi:hypothetical protein
VQLLAPADRATPTPEAAARRWRPPAPLPDPALLSYLANALTIVVLAFAVLRLAHLR